MMKTSLSWRRTGSGEPLLVLHGIGSTRDDFVALEPRLAAEFTAGAVKARFRAICALPLAWAPSGSGLESVSRSVSRRRRTV